MVKRKKMRGSIVVARADRIYRCLLDCAQPAVGNCHSRRRTKRPVHRSVSNEFYSDRNLFRSDKISASRTRFSPFLEIDSRETSIIVVSPSSHFTKLSSVVRNVRSNEFRESVDLRATVQRCWGGIFHVAPSHAKCLYLRHRRASHGMDTLLVIDHDIMKASTSSGSRGSIFSRCKFVAFSICSKRSKN